ncbi:MAG TPA: PAS domain S-box protein [Acetobacteraceae bacterium]|nr:PAS domain S-box protein [Acetobacteraceae bacterium]
MPLLEPQELHGVFDAVDTGLIVLDGECRIRGWNMWMVLASGIGADAVLGRRLEEVFSRPSPGMARLSYVVTEALSAGTSSILTHSLHGEILPLSTRAGQKLIHNVAVRPMGGQPARCLVQVNDVTVATERERVLRERQNARYDAVVGSAPDAILTLDTKGIIQLANPAAAREFGYPEAELVARPIAVLFEDQEAWRAAWNTLLSGEPLPRPVELVARRRDGSLSFLEMSASRWRTESRVFVTAILRDVNERRAAEEALRGMNQTLERRVAERTADRDRMWRLSTDIMLVAHLNGRISATNPAWNSLLGWDEAALRGMNLRELIAEEDAPKLEAALLDLAAGHAPPRFELGVRTRDGRRRSIAWSAVAADGLLQAVGRDVTAEREAEAALRQAEEALRQSQKMEAIGQLTGGIAHDFNNLLTGIIGSMDMLRRRIGDGRYEDLDRFMDAASASAERAAALTHRLLAFARRQPLDPRPLNVNALVESMEDLLRRSLGEQVEFVSILGEDVWPALTDGNQLENALLNLAINGRDAMPDGGRLTIETGSVSLAEADMRGREEMEPGDYTVICVADTGTGMSPETAAKAFDPFFTTKPVGQGTGLGLSMIYGFVKQSRGHVRIESDIGQGTKVSLYLPRHQGPFSGDATHDLAAAPQGAGETVLLVEDDASVRLLIAEVLRELGYACVEARDGQAALPILASEIRLDLMITDVGLPGLNGRQLAEMGRQHRPGLKVLFVTGYAEHATTREEFLAPGMRMVTKPFTLDALAVKIREMIGS